MISTHHVHSKTILYYDRNGKQKLEAMMDDLPQTKIQNHIILLSFIIFILNLYVYSYNIILPSLMTQYSFNIILPSLMTQQI